MIARQDYAGRRVLVLGLTEHGLAAARALKAGGARVEVYDGDKAYCAQAQALKLDVVEPTARDWGDLELLVCGNSRDVEAEPAPRLIELARALEIEVLSAEQFLAQSFSVDARVSFAAFAGRHAICAADIASHVLKSAGRAVMGPDLGAAGLKPVPGLVGVMAFNVAADISGLPQSVCLLDGAEPGPSLGMRFSSAPCTVLCSGDDPASRRLAVTAGASSLLVSGKQALAQGVFVTGRQLIDAREGAAKRVCDLSQSPALKRAPPLAIAAAYAFARQSGLDLEEACQGLSSYQGTPGHGRILARLGGLCLEDWSSATDGAGLSEAFAGPDPIVWIAGPSVDPKMVKDFGESATTLSYALLPQDRRKARRKLAKLCPVRLEREPMAIMARALYAAAKAGPRTRIVYAPAGPCDADFGESLSMALDDLIQSARRKDAA